MITIIGQPPLMVFIKSEAITPTTAPPLCTTTPVVIAWFRHRMKRGVGHNWEGTSCGAESDIFDSIVGDVRGSGFNITEMVTDKDSSVNAIYCRHFPEGTITYCSNHSAKTIHKHLQRVKQIKCQVYMRSKHVETGLS